MGFYSGGWLLQPLVLNGIVRVSSDRSCLVAFFYKRGCQEAFLRAHRRARIFSCIQPLCGSLSVWIVLALRGGFSLR